MDLRSRQWYTWSSGPKCYQLSRWKCTLHQDHEGEVPIIVNWCHFSASSPEISSCPVIIFILLPNSYHNAAATLHTSCYCATEKSFFTKADDTLPLKLFKLFKFRPLSSISYCYVSPQVCHKEINYFKHATITLYLYYFCSTQKSAVQTTHAWWLWNFNHLIYTV